MNNKTLDEKQLDILRNFIKRKGILETDVINEVLDHFACKVEELLNGEWAHLPFERLVVLAHQSFGPSGFRNLVIRYEKEVEKLMWLYFKQELKSILMSPIIILPMLLAIICYPTIQTFNQMYNPKWLWGFDFGLLAYLAIVIFLGFYQLMLFSQLKGKMKHEKNRYRFKYYWQQQVLTIPQIPFLITLIPIAIGTSHLLIFNGIVAAILVFILCLGVIRIMAQKRTFYRLEKHFANQMG